MNDEELDEIMDVITTICWETLDCERHGVEKHTIIHWFTQEVLDYLNDYCTKGENNERILYDQN